MKVLINEQSYILSKSPVFSDKTIELHFEDFSSDINFNNGVIIYSKDPLSDGRNCLSYNKKWNVLTELEDGIVLTNSNEVETEDNRLAPYPEFDPEPEIPSLEERIRDLETAICELAEGE